MNAISLVTLAPGHFHAALIQKSRPPEVSPDVRVYSPPGPDLDAHLGRVAGFGLDWKTHVHTGDDFLDRFRAEAVPGSIAVIAGRNRGKLDLIRAAVESGLHVLADKPLIIDPTRLSELCQTLAEADAHGLCVCDVMTERFEITSMLQRELIQNPDVFGDLRTEPGPEPTVFMCSVHYLKKSVAGRPLVRPPWFFDIAEQGNALADVGTHLVDLSMWLTFPDQVFPETDVVVSDVRRWSVPLSAGQYQAITGLTGENFLYECNTTVRYSLRGMPVQLDVLWDVEAESASRGGGDLHHCDVRGSLATVSVVQEIGPGAVPEVVVCPNDVDDRARIGESLRACVACWQDRFPGVAVHDSGELFQLHIPASYRVGHEAHFGQVLELFLRRVRGVEPTPTWETANFPTKYRVTTSGMATGGPAG